MLAIDRNLVRSKASATTTLRVHLPYMWVGTGMVLCLAVLAIAVQTLRLFRRERNLQRLHVELQKSHDGLETRVKERTADLSESNTRLKEQIEERLRAEEARQNAEQELEDQRLLSMRADRLRSLGEMAAGIAHELNQPLVGVRGLAEHLLIGMDRGWELTQDKLRDRMARIMEQADRMVHIIDHVRMFAREAGKPELAPVQVNDVVQSGMDMVNAQFRSRGVDLESDLAEGLPPVSANPFSLEEVILNLLNNARDALEEQLQQDSPLSPARVLVRTKRNGKGPKQGAKIEIVDNGPGIPPHIVDRVFDPFFTTKDPDRGTGLGLSVSKSIVEAFDGAIQIRTMPEGGTRVTISLPAANDSPDGGPKETEPT